VILLIVGIFTGCTSPYHYGPSPTPVLLTGLHVINPYALATALGTNMPATADAMAGMSGMTTPSAIHPTSVYLTLVNYDAQSQILISASTDVSTSATFHNTTVTNNIAQMKVVPQIVIPPGGTIDFAPGGLHIMLDGLRHDLVVGDTLNLSLYFAGRMLPLIVSVPARSPLGQTP
jgi:copper(I)-binding protein